MVENFSNAYSTTLNGSINNSQTTLVVTSTTGAPPSTPFRLRIFAEGSNTTEIVTVTGTSSTTYTITRASEAYAGVQSASAHASGAIVEHVLTTGALLSVVRYPLDTYQLDSTYGDDFTASSLSGIWTRRNFTGSNETFQYGQTGTYLRLTMTGRTGGDGYLQTAPGGDWTFMMSGIGHNALWPYWAIVAIDSSGTGIGTFAASSPSGVGLGTITTYTSYGGTFTLQTGTTAGTGAAQKYWQYLRKSGTTYYMAFSLDGEVWGAEVSLTSSATINRIGMMIHPYPWGQGGGTTSSLEDIDVFNKIA